jgi:hypothetical protein
MRLFPETAEDTEAGRKVHIISTLLSSRMDHELPFVVEREGVEEGLRGNVRALLMDEKDGGWSQDSVSESDDDDEDSLPPSLVSLLDRFDWGDTVDIRV